jgi:hypothetical protein
LSIAPVLAGAAAPQLDYLFPAGARQGAKDVVITAGGKFETWPVKVWTNAPEKWLQFTPASDEKKKGELTLSVDSDCAPGAYLVRLYSAQGVTAPRIFVVGTLPEESEAEPNDTLQVATLIAPDPPVKLINGKLGKSGDVDCFAMELAAGQTITAEVAAYVLDSPVDPLLHIRGPGGYRIAFNHDAPGHLLDPRLVFTAPTAGRYVLELAGFAHPPRADIRLTGSAATRYRLTLATGAPLATHTWPLAIERGSVRALRVHLTDGSTLQHEVTVPKNHVGESLTLLVPGCPRPVAVRVSDGIEYEESALPEKLQFPCGITANIGEASEVDRFHFHAAKGETYVFRVDAAVVGSSLDPVLAVADATGKELMTNDDKLHRFDPELTWKAPADGEFSIAVQSRFRRQSGAAFFYRLQCNQAAMAHAEVTAAADSLTLKQGGKIELTLNVTRVHGHAAALALESEGLPEGITLTPAEIPGDAKGEWKLTLESSSDSKLEPSCNPFCLKIHEPDGAPLPVRHSLKGTNADAGEMLINETPDLWLTIEGEKESN